MYDVIVVGGGHAGVEAALAAAKMNKKTALCTLIIDKIAMMPCNPSIGGPAKGVVVREIDALGGQMGITADKTALQFKLLNTNKGPGVRSLRVQSDQLAYSEMMRDVVLAQPNLDVLEVMVKHVLVENRIAKGIVLMDDSVVYGKKIILTTGTYMGSKIMISDDVTEIGPENQPTTTTISEHLKQLGFSIVRMKTGTPPRVKTASVDFSKTIIQPGDQHKTFFSSETNPADTIDEQYPCYLTYTNDKTHQIINMNLHLSSMYSGVVEGVGARYCPSVEDKVVRFADKERHQIFLEPQSTRLDTTYCQGLSSSLPIDVQDRMIRTVAGLENAEVTEYGYAIEYDVIEPKQLYLTLETRKVKNLYCAGQIIGTSGYEEAAGLGLLASINAVLALDDKEPLILKRDEAYIGVMIDDLINKGTVEPYRLLTSRAEFRLLLRHDNAQIRLSKYGYDVGLLSKDRYEAFLANEAKKQALLEDIKTIRIDLDEQADALLEARGYPKIQPGLTVFEAIKRPKINLLDFRYLLESDLNDESINQIEIEVKYAGYIEKAKKEADRLKVLQNWKIPENFDYDSILQLSTEGKQRLMNIKPLTIDQASRISGVNPADIQVLLMVLTQRKAKSA
ncbi:MAG: tRNA uridine-5-carboxymethylaminomethyl(34) synthesis enzyme MnmG [Erysipelothrix sp.]|jgi:tRNA uridine 5-carboxymethylaminomethyl modification enzyme|nr:tRNA uridine-5-carboxymethylaminomethyl(34) synthesis enzyme MnmG [Erysipelothrix sp.]